jgi:hypothetical protein
VVAASACLTASVAADDQIVLPTPLRVADAVRIAKQHRAEVVAARARARAAVERPAIVSALDDPEVSQPVLKRVAPALAPLAGRTRSVIEPVTL